MIEGIFEQFVEIRNLHVNVNKTIYVPLRLEGLEEVRAQIGVFIPRWAGMCIDTNGTCFGFVTEPGKGKESWRKPAANYISSVDENWAHLGACMQYAALTYKVFSTLLNVS